MLLTYLVKLNHQNQPEAHLWHSTQTELREGRNAEKDIKSLSNSNIKCGQNAHCNLIWRVYAARVNYKHEIAWFPAM